jgi:hypothetical protein
MPSGGQSCWSVWTIKAGSGRVSYAVLCCAVLCVVESNQHTLAAAVAGVVYARARTVRTTCQRDMTSWETGHCSR